LVCQYMQNLYIVVSYIVPTACCAIDVIVMPE